MNVSDIQRARTTLGTRVAPTRLIPFPELSAASGAEVFLKLECENATGSFKPRGALHTILCRLQQGPLPGVVTSSTGNHGAAVAYAARQLGVPAVIFLPENPNQVKRGRIAREGARIVEVGAFLEDSRRHAAKYASEHGWHLIIDGQDDDLTAGAGTIGLEIVEQVSDVDTILVPVGDGSLIRGVACAAKGLKKEVRIVGVVAERAQAYYLSWKQRKAICTDSSDTIADGLAVRDAVDKTVSEMLVLVDDMKMVGEEEMLAGMKRLMLDAKVIAEPSGAATTAALLKSGTEFSGRKVVLVVSGSNVGEELLRRALA
jgi:threonine dehydratase